MLNGIAGVKVFLEIPIDIACINFVVIVYGSFGVQITTIENRIAIE